MSEFSEGFRLQLKKIIQTQSEAILDEPDKLESLLNDYCGQNASEITLLMRAHAEGVPQKIIALSPAVPIEVTLARLTDSLSRKSFINKDAARWVVDTWA